jgi:hypothetical protein
MEVSGVLDLVVSPIVNVADSRMRSVRRSAMTASSERRLGVLLLAPRPGETEWQVLPIDARGLDAGGAEGRRGYRSADEALRAAQRVIEQERLADPVKQFGRYMQEFMQEAETRGEDRSALVATLQTLLQRAAHGGESIQRHDLHR